MRCQHGGITGGGFRSAKPKHKQADGRLASCTEEDARYRAAGISLRQLRALAGIRHDPANVPALPPAHCLPASLAHSTHVPACPPGMCPRPRGSLWLVVARLGTTWTAPVFKKPVILAPIPGRKPNAGASNGQGAATDGEPFKFVSIGLPCTKFSDLMKSPENLLLIDARPYSDYVVRCRMLMRF